MSKLPSETAVGCCSIWNIATENGLPPKSKLFFTVIDEYIRYRERDHRHGKTSTGMLRQIIRVSKFWREYAGDIPIEAIDDKVMREFIPWRRDYYANFKKLPKNAKLHPTDNHASRAAIRQFSWHPLVSSRLRRPFRTSS